MANYLTTFSGYHINPLEPKIEDIQLRDIAHALSLICRGNGQTTHFYSVGQHCINCAKEAKARGYNEKVQLLCLLHDASEAYMADLIRPIKQYMEGYQKIEDSFLKVILQRFGISVISDEEWKLVRAVDDDLLDYDLVILLKEPMRDKEFRFVRLPDIEFTAFEEVENEYYALAESLIKQL